MSENCEFRIIKNRLILWKKKVWIQKEVAKVKLACLAATEEFNPHNYARFKLAEHLYNIKIEIKYNELWLIDQWTEPTQYCNKMPIETVPHPYN